MRTAAILVGPGLTADTIAAAQALDQAGTPRAQIARTLGISRSSVYRSLVSADSHLTHLIKQA